MSGIDDWSALDQVVTVADLAPFGGLHQRIRRDAVRHAAQDAQRVLVEAATGRRGLVDGVLTACCILRAAEREIMRAEIDEDAA